MSKLASGYTQYFNHEYNHSGVLFQGPFQAHPILNDNKLCWLSGYVNCNYEIHKLGKAEDWRFSSYLDYLKQRDGKLINKQPILELFNNIESYKEHCQKVIQEAQGKEKTRKMLLE